MLLECFQICMSFCWNEKWLPVTVWYRASSSNQCLCLASLKSQRDLYVFAIAGLCAHGEMICWSEGGGFQGKVRTWLVVEGKWKGNENICVFVLAPVCFPSSVLPAFSWLAEISNHMVREYLVWWFFKSQKMSHKRIKSPFYFWGVFKVQHSECDHLTLQLHSAPWQHRS